MNTLKKKIIYYYIIITTILLIVEWYLYQAFHMCSDTIVVKWGVSETALEILAIFIGFAIFACISHLYYQKISERIQEETVRQLKERNLLFANIAHDLKNPMSSILGLARAIEQGNVSDEEERVIVHTICDKSLQVDDLIRKMFQYAKMETEGYELQKQKADICRIIREGVAAMYPQMEEKDMELDMNLPEEKVIAEVDSVEYARVVQNLVANAIKHNEEGTKIGIYMQSKTSKKNDTKQPISKKAATEVQLVIADTGIAIAKEKKESIFEPFQCSDESRTTKDGSGLGLAIARRIMQLHNGELYVEDHIKGYTKGFMAVLYSKQ